MKKSNIIVLITLIVIFAGFFINGITLRKKFINKEYDDPYRKAIKVMLAPANIVHFPNPGATYNLGKTTIIQNDTLHQLLSVMKDISWEEEAGKLSIYKSDTDFKTLVYLSDLTEVEVLGFQSIEIKGFKTTNLLLYAEGKGNISLIDCEIENLIAVADNEGGIYIDTTNFIRNIDLKLTSKSSFTSIDIDYENFMYEAEDDCSLNLSGKSLRMLEYGKLTE